MSNNLKLIGIFCTTFFEKVYIFTECLISLPTYVSYVFQHSKAAIHIAVKGCTCPSPSSHSSCMCGAERCRGGGWCSFAAYRWTRRCWRRWSICVSLHIRPGDGGTGSRFLCRWCGLCADETGRRSLCACFNFHWKKTKTNYVVQFKHSQMLLLYQYLYVLRSYVLLNNGPDDFIRLYLSNRRY